MSQNTARALYYIKNPYIAKLRRREIECLWWFGKNNLAVGLNIEGSLFLELVRWLQEGSEELWFNAQQVCSMIF